MFRKLPALPFWERLTPEQKAKNTPITLLGAPLTLEQEAQITAEKEEQQRLLARISIWQKLLLEGYVSGELSFDMYSRLCNSIIRCNAPDKPNLRNRWLGESISLALSAERKKAGRGKKGTPNSIRAAALEILNEVHQKQGLPLTRAPGNAYEKCCEIFTRAGYGGICPTELEKWWAKSKNTRIKE